MIYIWLMDNFSPILNSKEQTASLPDKKKSNILVHITKGPENPTRAALGFLADKTALEEGHTVTIFFGRRWSEIITRFGSGHLMTKQSSGFYQSPQKTSKAT